MSKTIDERVVQMTFNNKDFEKGASQTIDTLGKLTSSFNLLQNGNAISAFNSALRGINFEFVKNSLAQSAAQFDIWGEAVRTSVRKVTEDVYVATKKMVYDLTLANPVAGWTKLTQKNASIQTLMNSTGMSADEVDKVLEKLMRFSDETSYGFTDMTSALATMVASGGDINKLIPMIEGMANATAYAGKGAAEFTRVIYNLNQSYSSGALTLMDWKSVQNAGVNSKALMEQLILAGEKAKTIRKGQVTVENFASSLEHKWVTKEVMEQGFGFFAQLTEAAQAAVEAGEFDTFTEAYDKLGKNFDATATKAAKAAQEAKSFQEVIDATKDAVGSKWMQIFNAIIGNFDETRALWSLMAEDFYTLFAEPLDRLIDIADAFHSNWDPETILGIDENGEEIKAMTQLEALWFSFNKAITAVKDNLYGVFKTVFPIIEYAESSGRKIFNFIEILRNGLESIAAYFNGKTITTTLGREIPSKVSNIDKIFRAILSTINAVLRVGKLFITEFVAPLAKKLQPIADEILVIFGKIGDIIFKFTHKIAYSKNDITGLFSKVLDTVQPLIDILKTALGWIEKFIDGIVNKSSKTGKATNNFSLLALVLDFIKKAFESLANIIDGVAPVFDKIKNFLSNLGEGIKIVYTKVVDMLKNLFSERGDQIKEVAGGGIIGYFVLTLTGLLNNLKKFFKGGSININLNFFEKIKDAINDLLETVKKLGETKIKTDIIKSIGTTILEIAGALFIVSLIPADSLAISLAGIGSALIGVYELVKKMSTLQIETKQLATVTGAMIGVGAAMILLALALKTMSSIPYDQMLSGVVAMGAILAFVGLFVNSFEGNTSDLLTKKDNATVIKSIGKAMIGIGIGLIAIAAALKIIASIEFTSMMKALLGTALALAAVYGFIALLSKSLNKDENITGNTIKSMGNAMVNIGVGLVAIAVALKIVATIPWDQMIIGVVGLTAALAAIFGFAVGVSKLAGAGSFAAISASMLLMAPAILVLSAALKILGTMDITQVTNGLNALMQAMFIIGIFGGLLSLIGGGGAFALVAVGMLILSSSLIILAGALKALSMINTEELAQSIKVLAVSLGLIGGLGAILGILSPLLLAFSLALVVFGAGLKVVASGMAQLIAITMLFNSLGDSISLSVSKAIMTVFAVILGLIPDLIMGVIDAIINLAAQIIDAIAKLITIVCEGIKNGLGPIIDLLFSIVIAIIYGLSSYMDQIADNILLLIINTINAVADAIRGNSEGLGSAIANLIEALIEGVFNVAVGFGGTLLDKFSNWITGGKETKEINSSAVTAGRSIGENIGEGITGTKDDLTGTTEETLIGVSEDVQTNELKDSFAQTGTFSVEGIVTGLTSADNLNKLFDAGQLDFSYYKAGFDSAGGINSPSKVMAKDGKYVIQGLIKGLKTGATDLSNVGGSTFNAIEEAIAASEDLLDTEVSNPVITPVLDLSKIQNGARSISGLLNGTSVYGLTGQLAYAGGFNNMQNSPINVNINFDIDNAGKDITDADVNRWSSQLVHKLDEELGKMFR